MRYCVFRRIGGGIAFGLTAILTAGCDTIIHKEANIGGVDTLSIDAKQRLMVVANRVAGDGALQQRVACTEPSPDALVAKAAAIAASGNVDTGSEGAGGGGIGGGFSERAASLAFRDHTVQMLRDGYYRICEAYMNGGLSERKYKEMVKNADTFMVVAAALQTLGNNPVAPPVAVSSGDVDVTVDPEGKKPPTVKITGAKATFGGTGSGADVTLGIKDVSGSNNKISIVNARAAAGIIDDYLEYRLKLGQDLRRAER